MIETVGTPDNTLKNYEKFILPLEYQLVILISMCSQKVVSESKFQFHESYHSRNLSTIFIYKTDVNF